MNLKNFISNNILKIPKVPEMFFLDLTEKCNLNCVFCYNKKTQRKHGSIETIIEILTKMAKSGCKEVMYLGGEPTLHPNFWEILNYAESIGIEQSFISNGQIINDSFAQRLLKYKKMVVGISIHSNEAVIQNKLSRSEKSFTNIKKSIQSLEKYRISWYAQMSLLKENYEHLLDMQKFLLSMGHPERLDISRIVDIDNGKCYTLSENNLVSVFKQIELIDFNKLPIRIECFPRCWLNKISKIYSINYKKIKRAVRPCYAWIAQVSLDIYGNIRLCPTGGVIAGNIIEESLEDIWKNESIKKFQDFKWQEAKCISCEDFAFCVGGCKMTCYPDCPMPDKLNIWR